MPFSKQEDMEQKRSTNLCSIYILPLIDLNKYSFGDVTNFVNSYLNEDDLLVVVKVQKPVKNMLTHGLFRFSYDQDGHVYYVFELPTKYSEIAKKFREGKYSLFSEEAKNQIKKRSGLSYRVPTSAGGVKSAKELLALDKDKKLREKWEAELDVKLSQDAELMDIPGEDNFIQLSMLKSTDLELAQ